MKKKKQYLYAIYPGSEHLDLGPKRCVALCSSTAQALTLIKLWAPWGYYEVFEASDPPGLVKQFLKGEK